MSDYKELWDLAKSTGGQCGGIILSVESMVENNLSADEPAMSLSVVRELEEDKGKVSAIGRWALRVSADGKNKVSPENRRKIETSQRDLESHYEIMLGRLAGMYTYGGAYSLIGWKGIRGDALSHAVKLDNKALEFKKLCVKTGLIS
jgi:hypothetical protein